MIQIIWDFIINFFNCEDTFSYACRIGNLDLAKKIYNSRDIDKYEIEEGFIDSCINNYLHIAKWILSLDKISVHCNNDGAFRLCCCKGNLEIAQWLVSLPEKPYINSYIDGFMWASEEGHLSVAKWLHSLGEEYICDEIDIKQFYERHFNNQITKGNFDMAIWFRELKKTQKFE